MALRSIVLLITFGPVSIPGPIHQCWVMFRLVRLKSSSQSHVENLMSDQSESSREAEMNAGECYADHYHSRFQDSFTLFVTPWELLETETSLYTWLVLGLETWTMIMWSNHRMWSVMDEPYQTRSCKTWLAMLHQLQFGVGAQSRLARAHIRLIPIDDSVIGLKHWQPEIQMGELSRNIENTISDNNNHSPWICSSLNRQQNKNSFS